MVYGQSLCPIVGAKAFIVSSRIAIDAPLDTPHCWTLYRKGNNGLNGEHPTIYDVEKA